MSRMIRFLVVAGTVAVAFASAPPDTMAQGIHVLDEGTGTDCSPCTFHATGSSTIIAHTPFDPVEASSCQDELEGEFRAESDGNGSGGHLMAYANDHAADLPLTLTESVTPHQYRADVGAIYVVNTVDVEVTASWTTETSAHAQFELVHAPAPLSLPGPSTPTRSRPTTPAT